MGDAGDDVFDLAMTGGPEEYIGEDCPGCKSYRHLEAENQRLREVIKGFLTKGERYDIVIKARKALEGGDG